MRFSMRCRIENPNNNGTGYQFATVVDLECNSG